MTNNANGSTWDINAPAGLDARSLGAIEIRGLRAGIAIRMDKEHKALVGTANPADGGEHKEGSAVAYYETSAPSNRPDGNTLTAADEGRLLVLSDTKAMKVYDGNNFVSVTSGLSASGGVNITTDMNSPAGWTNNTGGPVLVNFHGNHPSVFSAIIDYGAGNVGMNAGIFHSNRYFIWGALIVPNGSKIGYNVTPLNSTHAVYQLLGA